MKKYFIVWTYGQHFATIETDKEDFKKIINCLSDEFEIHKEKRIYKENTEFNNTAYYIYNYYGDKEVIGYEY